MGRHWVRKMFQITINHLEEPKMVASGNLHVPKTDTDLTERGAYNTNASFTKPWWCHNDLFVRIQV